MRRRAGSLSKQKRIVSAASGETRSGRLRSSERAIDREGGGTAMASSFSALVEALQTSPPPAGDIFWYKAHGFFMWFSFSVLFPLGILGVRYGRLYKNLPCWYQYHWIVQSTGVVLASGGLSIALRRFAASKNSYHGCIGFALSLIILLQPILAIFRPKTGDRLRPCWAFSHWFLGTLAVILGWVNIYKGLDMFFLDWPTATHQTLLYGLFSVQVAILGFFYLVMMKCPDSDCDKPSTFLGKPLLEKQFLVNV